MIKKEKESSIAIALHNTNQDGYDQVMFTQNVETIEPFSSHVVPVKAGRA